MPLDEHNYGNQKRTYSARKITQRVGQGGGVLHLYCEGVSSPVGQREIS